MHPVITAWIVYDAYMRQQPIPIESPEWPLWLDQAIELSDWFNTLRRLAF